MGNVEKALKSKKFMQGTTDHLFEHLLSQLDSDSYKARSPKNYCKFKARIHKAFIKYRRSKDRP